MYAAMIYVLIKMVPKLCKILNYRVARKKLTRTFSYNSGSLAVIIRFLSDPLDALWLCHRRKRFLVVVYFKLAPQRGNQVKVSALLRAVHKVSEVANLVVVPRTTVYGLYIRDQEADGQWRRCQQTCRKCSWNVNALFVWMIVIQDMFGDIWTITTWSITLSVKISNSIRNFLVSLLLISVRYEDNK